ncbi:MAG: rhomboid family intramembrane serine protease [Verrucomicrobiota bacterium]
MSLYSRDYMKDDQRPRGPGGPSTWSVVVWLLVINAAVFVVALFTDRPGSAPLQDALGLSIQSLTSFRIWTLLTYQVIHESALHLIVNMIGLLFIGRLLLQMTGRNHFLKIYLLGGIAGGVLQILYNLIVGSPALIIGASGCVMALIFALATLIPHQTLNFLLFFVIPVRLTARQIIYLIIAFEVITFALSLAAPGEGSRVAVFAHAGGMLFGWLYIKYWFSRSAHGSGTGFEQPQRKKSFAERFGIRIIKDAKNSQQTPNGQRSGKKPFVTSDVDAILDKINEKGFQSLTEEEKKTLEKSSSKLSKRLDQDH